MRKHHHHHHRLAVSLLVVLAVLTSGRRRHCAQAFASSSHPFGVSSSTTTALHSTTSPSSSSSSTNTANTAKTTTTTESVVPTFLTQSFASTVTECDNTNRPPSLNILLRSLQQLCSQGSDIRGKYVDHAQQGSIAAVAHVIGSSTAAGGGLPALTPLAAYCLGHALAQQLLEYSDNDNEPIDICIGQDPRLHGMRLADSLARGAASAASSSSSDCPIRVLYTGIATTPACAAFLDLHNCHAAVMVTASHLPKDRNGFKVFYNDQKLMNMPLESSPQRIRDLGQRAADYCASDWYNKGVLPPSSGNAAVMCTQHVQYMPAYMAQLQQAVCDQVGDSTDNHNKPLKGLKIVLNAGHGAGGFFHQVLRNLGANTDGSIHLQPDGNFPAGYVPNPESAVMEEETIAACQRVQADLGIMLDTDADRCGFVVPVPQQEQEDDDDGTVKYEPLNRNRLIALLGVIFAESSPGCAMVTDSVTSEGLASFLQDELGLVHVRYLKGYNNVISKAKELTLSGQVNAEVAIETSGHCAMKENNYLDDGTYTAVKVCSLLARQKQQSSGASSSSLLDLIAAMPELDEIAELRMSVQDESLDTMRDVFDFLALAVEDLCNNNNNDDSVLAQWSVDQDNLEGIRIRVGNQGQFLMLRKSLHDPIISLQIEAQSREEARKLIVEPLVQLLRSEPRLTDTLQFSVLEEY